MFPKSHPSYCFPDSDVQKHNYFLPVGSFVPQEIYKSALKILVTQMTLK